MIDLSWLAVGRLLYETDQFTQAVQAYNHVDRTSPEFGTMLYELAWVYVRLGDVDRAQRALEVLAVADPESQNIADGSLLRADLMLRAGQFDKSLKIYEGVRGTYDPMKAKVDAFLGSTSDPAVYYDKLSQEQLEALDSTSILPPLAVQWAREAEDGPAAFAVIDDVASCRDLIKDSNEIIERLNAVLSSPNRVRAFPELKAGEQKALSYLNRIGEARVSLGQGMDDVTGGGLAGEIGSWRARGGVRSRTAWAFSPVNETDFQEREGQATGSNRNPALRRGLQRLQLQVDTLQATINGLRRVLREGPQSGVVRDPATIARFEEELQQNEHDLALYRRQMEELRKLVNAGRVQVGFGDQRFIEDDQVRKAYREAVNKEAELAAAGQERGVAPEVRPTDYAAPPRRRHGRSADRRGHARARRRGAAEVPRNAADRGCRDRQHGELPGPARSTGSERAPRRRRGRSAKLQAGARSHEGHRPPRRRGHHRRGVGGPRRAADARAQPSSRAVARGQAPQGRAQRSAGRQR